MGSPSGAIPRSGCLRGEEDEDTDPNMKGEIKSAIHMRPKLGFIFFFGVLPNAPTFSFLYSLCFVLALNERERELKNLFVECDVINRPVNLGNHNEYKRWALSSAKRRCFILNTYCT